MMTSTQNSGPSYEWISFHRDYQEERQRRQLRMEEVLDHPLKPTIVTMAEGRSTRRIAGSASSTGSSTPSTPQQRRTVAATIVDPLGAALDGGDPLSQFAKEEMDPLSKMAADRSPWENSEKRGIVDAQDEDALMQDAWQSRKAAILSRFTTSEKLSIVTSFLSGGDKVIARPQTISAQQTSSAVEKVRTRLEQLDDFEEGSVREEGDLTQGEYAARIEQLNTELVLAWNGDQRVRALKIAIQCSKLLADTAVIQFYPSKFVLITDILDIFGQLVHDRLRAKAEGPPGTGGHRTGSRLPADFTPDMVPEAAKETCRNWFYKIASIRELVPRFYVETAILRSYSFLTSSEFSQALLRLTHMIRGIGDPLVAVFARCYLCRVGLSITRDRAYVQENLHDFLASHQQLYNRSVRSELARQRVDFASYLTLYTPALDWVLQVAAHPGTEQQLLALLARCQQIGVHSGLVLNSIMVGFKALYIAMRATEFVDLIMACDNDGFPQYVLFRTLGLCVVAAEPPREQHLILLNTLWKAVSRLSDVSHYTACAEVWIEFAMKYFSPREVNTLLADMIRHLTHDRAYESHYPQLQAVVMTLLRHCPEVDTLFAMDKFLPFLDMLQREQVRVEVCKSILEEFCRHQKEAIHDPVTISGLLFLSRVLHDSVSALTVEDEKRQIGNLICGFVKAVDFGRDFEQQLSFFVDARASFTNLDAVHVQLVQSVNRLAVDTRRIVSGHHTRKTAAFVRACAAYCFITIPSIGSVVSRLELYMVSGQVALLNQCLGQADACFKAALSLIPEMPRSLEVDGKMRSSEPFLVSYLSNFLSTLLVVPDPPEQGVLYLTRGLLKIVQQHQWENQDANKMVLYLNVLAMLAATTQESYLYRIENVDSNDALYGSDPKFIAEVERMSSVIIDEILSHLKTLDNTDSWDKQASLALELFQRIATLADLDQPSLATLALKLWILAHRRGKADPRSAARILEQLKKKVAVNPGPETSALAELLANLQARSPGMSELTKSGKGTSAAAVAAIGSAMTALGNGWQSLCWLVGSMCLSLSLPMWLLSRLWTMNQRRSCTRLLQDKVVLITGASSGLGEALAHAFYSAGCRVVLAARRVEELNRVRQELLMTHPTVPTHIPVVLPIDVSELNNLPERVETILSIHGQVDILVSNAGISSRGNAVDCSVDVDIKVMLINYLGHVALTKALLPSMLKKQSGHIVAVSSVQGRIAIPQRSAYSASKHALQAFSDSLRAEVADQGVKVTVISPGYIKTNLSMNALTGSGQQYAVMDAATAQGMPPEVVARRVVEATACGEQEVVLSTLSHKVAILLRACSPTLFFWLMRRRAQKAHKEQ